MRWKVKIRDNERVEDPHLSIIRGTTVWRVCLRDGRFMDGGSWKDMPAGLEQAITANWQHLCEAWDRMYPDNPVKRDDQEDEDENP